MHVMVHFHTLSTCSPADSVDNYQARSQVRYNQGTIYKISRRGGQSKPFKMNLDLLELELKPFH